MQTLDQQIIEYYWQHTKTNKICKKVQKYIIHNYSELIICNVSEINQLEERNGKTW